MVNFLLVKELRRQCGLTQQQVAEYLHIDRSTYAYYELGRTRINIEILVKLSRFYKVRLESLLNLPHESVENGEPLEDIAADFSHLSPQEQTLVILYRSGSSAQRKEVLAKAKEIVRAEGNKPPQLAFSSSAANSLLA